MNVAALLASNAHEIDHVAIAVEDLEKAIVPYTQVLGFAVTSRLATHGEHSGMVSAVLQLGKTTFVFTQGTSPESQVSRFIQHYGPGVTHIAIRVASSLPDIVDELRRGGVEFATDLVESPGLKQIFTKRDPGSGLMLELIQRDGGQFSPASVEHIFRTLEAKELY
jgi:methylmalonyl-CoA/ethylmalonyl-CoA epimerase